MFSMNNPTYQVGVRIELPIGNRTAKANYGSALVEETQIKSRMDQADQTIKSEVQNAFRQSARPRPGSTPQPRLAVRVNNFMKVRADDSTTEHRRSSLCSNASNGSGNCSRPGTSVTG